MYVSQQVILLAFFYWAANMYKIIPGNFSTITKIKNGLDKLKRK